MLFRKISLLALIFLLLSSFTGIALAKSTDKKQKSSTKPWAQVNGFRSAKFGMNEKKVLRAITKDFKISSSKIKKSTHPTERTTNLQIEVPDLLAAGGTARIGYVFGQSTKQLIQVNVFWGKGVSKKADNPSLVGAANLLRDHFVKKRYQKDGFTVNGKINDNTLIIFRGKDKKGRMILLMLTTPGNGNKTDKTKGQVSLALSYRSDPMKPDILTIKEGEF
jgi:hypothetical protein